MPSRLSKRAQSLRPSDTFRLAQRAAELKAAGKDVLAFGLGEPDFDTPEPARAAAKAAIDRGETHYTANEGMLALRQAVARAVEKEQGLRYEARGEVMITAGSKQAIAQSLMALVGDGDEVLIPSPYWVTYPELVRFCGGVVKFVKTDPADGFRLTADRIAAALSPQSRVLILNSPNNPTGAVLRRDDLVAIADLVVKRDLMVVSDEIYGALTYDGVPHVSPAAARPELRERTILCSGMSKAFAMTGWRLGYACGPREVLGAMDRIQSHFTSNASSISQHAAIAALEHGAASLTAMRAEFDRRRRLVCERLRALPGFELPPPTGAFYAFPRIAGLFGRRSRGGRVIDGSLAFVEALLDEALVSLMPGSIFGEDECVRLSYAASYASLERGLARVAEFVGGLTKSG